MLSYVPGRGDYSLEWAVETTYFPYAHDFLTNKQIHD